MFGGMHGGWGRDRGCGPRGGRGMPGGMDPMAFFEWARAMKGDGGGGGGRSRRMFDGGELRLLLLKLIGDEPRHGYDLIRTIEELTAGAYAPSPGVVYPTLTMLDEQGLVEEQRSEGAKKRFAITAEGRELLATNAGTVDELMARLQGLGQHRERSHGGPTRRAMTNLHMAVRERLRHGDLPEDKLHELAALIDELAQKIERLK